MSDEEKVMRAKTNACSRDEDRAVDAWLRQELTHRYNGSLVEPVPQDLLRLLDAD